MLLYFLIMSRYPDNNNQSIKNSSLASLVCKCKKKIEKLNYDFQ